MMIWAFVVACLVAAALDALWITLVMSREYGRAVVRIQQGQHMRIRWVPAIVAYVFVALGLFLALSCSQNTASLPRMILFSALLGLAVYGTYAFTVMSIFQGFPLHLAIMDTLWGAFLFGASITIARLTFKSSSTTSF